MDISKACAITHKTRAIVHIQHMNIMLIFVHVVH